MIEQKYFHFKGIVIMKYLNYKTKKLTKMSAKIVTELIAWTAVWGKKFLPAILTIFS